MIGRTESLVPECVPEEDEFDPLADEFISKQRRYLHFDLPLSEAERQNFSLSRTELAQRSFWPLLGFVQGDRRLKIRDDGSKFFEVKPREIKFGSHGDAAALEYYGRLLSREYEALLQKKTLTSSVLAYRSGVGNNIDQAQSIFEEIKTRGDCIAIAMDISKFFDRIDHEVLLEALKQVLDAERLPDADFHVYRTMTKFAWVDTQKLKQKLGKRRTVPGRLCTAQEFRQIVRGTGDKIIFTNEQRFGIPQGTPLSGLYANISMIEFDRLMSAYLKKRGGSYRRYSDDIAIVLPSDAQLANVQRHVKRTLNKFGLDINEKKTEIVRFSKKGSRLTAAKPFQYLGFTFDGEQKLIRSSSLGRYYEKMRRGIRAKVRAAYSQKIPADQIFMRELFKRYTHFGKYRNFPQYAYRAARIMDAPEIRRQIKPHMRHFKRYMREALLRVYGVATS